MTKTLSGKTPEQQQHERCIRDTMIRVAAKWPELSPGAFIEEVSASFYPRLQEYDLMTVMWAMFSDGTLLFTSKRKVKLPDESQNT